MLVFLLGGPGFMHVSFVLTWLYNYGSFCPKIFMV